MRYVSTRDASKYLKASQAIVQGLSRDGGLFTPEILPEISLNFLTALCDKPYAERALAIMKLFLEEFAENELEIFCRDAYSVESFDHLDIAPINNIDRGLSFLELWHGPTSAFKDMALQMLPYLLTSSMKKSEEKKEACILVATSGDTGKAALEGFRDVDGTRILVFYPKDGVSDIQKLQMTTQDGKNVGVCAVEGNFDDAQSGVKAIFSDTGFREELEEKGFFLSSANSINWGRLLPQIAYYFSAYCDLITGGEINIGEKINFCVPTGNFGNILAGYFAMSMGLPVNKLICASNTNNVLTDFFQTGEYSVNRELVTTISPSMDILISSNLERLLFLMSGSDDKMVSRCMKSLSETGQYRVDSELKKKMDEVFVAGYCDDQAAKNTIARAYQKYGYLMDTHTAVAYDVLERYRNSSGDSTHCVIVSTASPYKFCSSVLSALGQNTETEDELELIELLHRTTETEIPKRLNELKQKRVRFDLTVKKEEMKPIVRNMLDI